MLRGVFPVLPTPYGDDGHVDLPAMRRLVRFALGCGVDGIVFPGAASEVEELTPGERNELVGVVTEAVGGRVPVIVGGSAPTAAASIALIAEAAPLGARTAMVQAPSSCVGGDALVGYFSEIAAALPGVDIILQNAPPPRGANLDPRTILEIARRVPALRYVKEETLPSGAAISAILAEKPDTLAGVIGGGGARYLIDELQRGACAVMPALEIADVHVAVDRAFHRGDIAAARQLYIRTLPLLLIQLIHRMRLTKTVLMRRGVLSNALSRPKLPEFDQVNLDEIDAWLDEIGDLLAVHPVVTESVPA